jgi:taurine transport system permease protein
VLPQPRTVLAALRLGFTEGFANATLLGHATASLMRLAAAFVVAVVVGVPLGLVMGTGPAAREIVDPWIQLYKPVPSLAYMGLMVLWLGVGDASRIALLALAGLPAIVIGTTEAVRSVRPERIQGARSLGIAGLELFRTVIVPSCLPDILTAMRIASTGIFTTLIAAEMIGASTGLGSMLMAASYGMQLGMVIVGITAMGLAGMALDQIFRLLQRRCVPWSGRF